MSSSDPSFDIDGHPKGSYVRMIEDIGRALDYLKVEQMPPTSAFLFYYISCEKLAKIMMAICQRKTRAEIFGQGSYTPGAGDIRDYSQRLECNVRLSDINCIFDSKNKHSARKLRDIFVHEVGPSHAKQIVDHSPSLVPKMKNFLDSRGTVIQFIKTNAEILLKNPPKISKKSKNLCT